MCSGFTVIRSGVVVAEYVSMSELAALVPVKHLREEPGEDGAA